MGEKAAIDGSTRAGKAVALMVRTNTGRAAAAFVVSALVGLVTSLVTSQQGWALAASAVVLALLMGIGAVLAWYQQASQEQPGAHLPVVGGPGGIDFRYGVLPLQALTGSALARAGSGVTAILSSPVPPLGTGAPVDQVNVRDQLRTALASDLSGVVVMHGAPGVGKTRLVSWVLQEMGLDKAPRHDLVPGDHLDARALLEDIERDVLPSAGLRPGEDVLSRIEAAMEASNGPPVVIVVDGAQCLLGPDAVMSLDLEEALGVIARGWERQVKVLLIFQDELPTPAPGSAWPGAVKIWVGGLPREHFLTYLEGLDPAGDLGVAALIRTEPDALHHALRGIPRLAELFCAALALPQSRLTAAALARLLERQPLAERGRVLAREVVNCLRSDQRSAVVALAAYGTPVSIQAVGELLANELPPGQVPGLLPELAALHVISETSGRYHLPIAEIHEALTRLPDGPARLRHEAANLLSRSRKPEEEIRKPEDLDVHFAELDILVQAQLWGSSYELINTIDKVLQRWNAGGLLLKHRDAVAGKLGNNFHEMVNYNALGCIYTSRGESGSAVQAFESALRHASATTWPHGRRKIFINLAALSWYSGDTAVAEQRYRDALAMAEEHEDALDRMAAMTGLADCHRHWGDYRQAIRFGKLALSASQVESSPWAVRIAVKLARWYSELGDQAEAGRLMDVAEAAANDHYDPALRVQCLDGRADLLLDAGDFWQAREVAQRALSQALRSHDPVTVLQARTTMAMAYLRLGDIPAARREIDRAARYRRDGGPLVVLALQALIAFREDPDGEARVLFARLGRDALRRREHDERDFAAWDFEGLAICGTRVGRSEPLDPAVSAFRRAREQAPAPSGLDSRMKFWLAILQTKAEPGQMDPVVTAAASPAAQLRR